MKKNNVNIDETIEDALTRGKDVTQMICCEHGNHLNKNGICIECQKEFLNENIDSILKKCNLIKDETMIIIYHEGTYVELNIDSEKCRNLPCLKMIKNDQNDYYCANRIFPKCEEIID